MEEDTRYKKDPIKKNGNTYSKLQIFPIGTLLETNEVATENYVIESVTSAESSSTSLEKSNVDTFEKDTTYNNEVYERFFSCVDPIYSNIKPSLQCDSEQFLLCLEMNNVKTIGDLARLTPYQVKSLFIDVDIIKSILDNHNCDAHKLPTIIGPDPMKMLRERFDEKSFEKCMNASDDKLYSSRLDESPSSSSSSSPSSSPNKDLDTKWILPLQMSPKENVLNVNISGGKLQDVLSEIKNVFLEKVRHYFTL